MPNHEQHTLITWIPGSADGRREARRLHDRFRRYSAIRMPERLTRAEIGDYMLLIVVGHREEFAIGDVQESLVRLLDGSGCHWVVLANCSSGLAAYLGPLEHNELWSPAQRLANRLKIKVSGTSRALTFDEVGMGYAFALAVGEVLIRSNPIGAPGLWRDYEPQEPIDEITEGIGRL